MSAAIPAGWRARLGGWLPGPTAKARLGAVDAARGTAVAAMVVYHGAWDLSELRLIVGDIRDSLAWTWFSHAIAASFLVLVGVGLVLAQGRAFRPLAFLRRLGRIAGAALLVTLGTYLVFPDAFVFFGILHCIAAASVLGLGFRHAPPVATLAVAALVFAAPLVLTGAVFDAPILAFLGLGTRIPTTNDYVPLFPWFGFVLCGIALMRLARTVPAIQGSGWLTGSSLLRGLAFLGRHSLLIYLLHQPILFGAMSGWVELFGRSPAAEAAPFLSRCEASCRDGGESEPVCRATCGCAIAAFKADGLWANILRNQASPEERLRIAGVARQCFDRSRNPAGSGMPASPPAPD